MGLLDKFKKEEKKEIKKSAKKQPQVKVEKKAESVDEAITKAQKKTKASSGKVAKREFSEVAFRNLKYPLVTEKSTILSERSNQYVFKVPNNAGKNEIKKAIQDVYGVKVEKVNIIKVQAKKRRVGQSIGFKSGYKKAVVFLGPEERIEVITR